MSKPEPKKETSDFAQDTRRYAVDTGMYAVGFGASAVVAVAATMTIPPLAVLFGTFAALNGYGMVHSGLKTKAGKAVSAFSGAARKKTVARVKKMFHKKPGL